MTAPDIGTLEVEVRANFDRLVRDLEARLRAINKAQAIKLRVKLQESTLKALDKNLRSYTGINALTNEFRKAGDQIRGVFDNIGGLSRKFVGLGAAAGPLTVGIGVLSTAIVGLGTAAIGAGAALPGLALGFKASAFVFKTAFEDIPPVVQANIDKFKVIKEIIGKNFWEEATAGVNLLLKSALEPLKEGFGELATAQGNFVNHFASSISRAFTPEVYDRFFGGLIRAFDILAKHEFTDALARVMAQLAVFGAELFPRIAQGISDMVVRFDEFLKLNPTFLTDSFNTFVEVVKGAAAAVVGVAGIFQAISSAATAAGIGAGSFGTALKGIAESMKTDEFQASLTTFFAGAKTGMEGLTPALSSLGDLLGSLAPIFSTFMADSGVSVGNFFNELFTAMNKPEVIANFASAFGALPQIFDALAPVAGTMAEDFGKLAAFAGVLAVEFSKNLAVAIEAISPVMDRILPSVEKLTKALGEFFRTKLTEMKPQFEQIGEAIGGLVDGVTLFVEALNTPILKFILSLITNFIVTAVSGFANLAGGVLKVVAGLAQVLSGDFSGFAQIWDGIKQGLLGAFQLFITLFAPAKILGIFAKLVPGIGGFFTGVVTSIITRFASLINVIPGLGVRLMSALASRLTGGSAAAGTAIIQGLTRGVQALIGGLLVWLTDKIWNPVKSFFGINSPSTLFMSMGRFLIQGLINGIKALVGNIVGLFTGPITRIKAAFTGGFSAIRTQVNAVWTAISGAFSRMKSSITSGVSALRGALSGAASSIKSTFVNAFNAIKEKVLGVFRSIKNSIPKISIPGLDKLPGFASGVNNFSGGLALVGERGPEIVNLPKGSDVYTASQSRQMMGQGTQGGFSIGNIVINEANREPSESLPRALRNLAFTMGVA